MGRYSSGKSPNGLTNFYEGNSLPLPSGFLSLSLVSAVVLPLANFFRVRLGLFVRSVLSSVSEDFSPPTEGRLHA